MHRRFITLILCASLALTSVTPAHAGNKEKWIAGAAALVIIGLAINEEKKTNRKRRAQQQLYATPRRQHSEYKRKAHQNHGHSTTQGHAGPIIVKPEKKHAQKRRNLLPASCRVNIQLHGQKVRGFARGCLKRSNVNLRALPRQCAYRVRNPHNGNMRVIYGSRCLRDQGYRAAKGY